MLTLKSLVTQSNFAVKRHHTSFPFKKKQKQIKIHEWIIIFILNICISGIFNCAFILGHEQKTEIISEQIFLFPYALCRKIIQ